MSRLYPTLAVFIVAIIGLVCPTSANASTTGVTDILIPPGHVLPSSVVVDTQPEPVGATSLQEHVIEQGDTYWDIAFHAGIDVQALLDLNHLSDASRLDVGQVLLVPANPNADDTGVQPTPIPTAVPAVEDEVAALEADQEIDEIGQAVVLVLDNTGSMAGAAFQAQMDAVDDLVATFSDTTQVAIVTYSGSAQVAFPFSADRSALDLTLNRLGTGGDAALYDGVLTAASEAARIPAQRRSVVVITDGAEASSLSESAREDAIDMASDEGIPVITVALGPNADREYLSDLSEATDAQTYTAAAPENLATLVSRIANEIESVSQTSVNQNRTTPGIPPLNTNNAPTTNGLDEMTASLMSPSLVELASEGPSIPLPGRAGSLNIPLPGSTVGSATTLGANDQPVSHIPPIEDAITELDLNGAGRIQPQSTIVAPAPTPLPAAMPTAVVREQAIPPNPARLAEDLTSNVTPISIEVAPGTDVDVAELAINGYRLETFETAPYEYDLDTNMLDEGQYNLTFTVVNSSGVVSAGTLDFEVVVIENGAPADSESNVALASTGSQNTTASRVILINGERQPFDLQFDTEGGLSVVVPEAEQLVMPQQSLLDILAAPTNNLIPPSVRAALTTPRPTESAIVIILMTLTLMPQGLFTLYWMMFSWNSPQAVEESQAPRVFVEPQKSFTALLPARHEEDVIKDTIFAVDRIDYPDELKEILILIRDDDKGTMEKAQEAIDELGKTNVRLVTFSTGPINKPHGLNIGLGEATKEVVCVFDAEDEPHPEIYNVINTVMLERDVDVVQSGVQLMNFRSNWFSALNVLEYFFWFKSGLHCFTRQFHVTPLGGNTVFFKRHYLEQIGGWDEQCLTEDADVGIRLTLQGAKIDIVYDAEYATREETPATVESFIKQRTRWNQGFYQIFFKGDWAKLPTLTQRITAIYILLNSLMQAAIILFLPIGIFIAVTQQVALPVALFSYIPIFLLMLQLVTSLIGIREFTEAYGLKLPLGFRAKMLIAYYPYQLLLTVSAVRAVFRYITQKQSWEKTTHANLHRQGQVLGRA